MTPRVDLVRHAGALAGLGWPVFPVRPGGKSPLEPGWPSSENVSAYIANESISSRVPLLGKTLARISSTFSMSSFEVINLPVIILLNLRIY